MAAARSIDHSERTSSTTIERGLYILRYVGSSVTVGAPSIHLRPSYGSEDTVQFVSMPGLPSTSLLTPGSLLVIRAESSVNLQITVSAPPGGVLDAELNLEPLDGRVQAGTGRGPASVALGAGSRELEVMAHLPRLGDQSFSAGRWIGGPEAPTPIEGIAARWSSEFGERLEYQVLLQKASTWSAWTGDGDFAGSRGDWRPLAGLRFRLTGSGQHVLKVSALFLGASMIERTGQVVELVSSTGYDPLVGLKVSVLPSARSTPKPPQEPAYAPAERRGRVRVFRASGEPS